MGPSPRIGPCTGHNTPRASPPACATTGYTPERILTYLPEEVYDPTMAVDHITKRASRLEDTLPNPKPNVSATHRVFR